MIYETVYKRRIIYETDYISGGFAVLYPVTG